MGYGDGLPRTRMGRATWEVYYSGPGPGPPARRGTRSKNPWNRVSDVGKTISLERSGAIRTCILPSADPE